MLDILLDAPIDALIRESDRPECEVQRRRDFLRTFASIRFLKAIAKNLKFDELEAFHFSALAA